MKEYIILAGGLGTRLQSVVNDVPKCMAPIAGKPFLYYILKYAEQQKAEHIILSLGYKSEIVTEWLKTTHFGLEISYIVEEEPLGTGGAIKYAFEKVRGTQALAINGDTFFSIDILGLGSFHTLHNADISIALKPMTDFDRYGSVEINKDMRVTKFNEKQFCDKGLINGGIYAINKTIFDKFRFPGKFSFETDVLEGKLEELDIYGYIQDAYFIDIGIPTDYEKANKDFSDSTAF